MRRLLFLFFLFISSLSLHAVTLGENATISLLINSPGTETYSLFGHACFRINDPDNERDMVFNYGMFSFEAPNFLYRFVKGETDYMLGVYNFNRYAMNVAENNQQLTELMLQLTASEKEQLWNALLQNAQPENRVYRYNFVYDNCATRLRDMLEQNIQDKIDFHYTQEGKSFRCLINEYAPANGWAGFGMNLLIGSKSDLPQKEYYYCFLPDYLTETFERATIDRSGTTTPLVGSKQILIEKEPEVDPYIPTPQLVLTSLLCIIILITFYEYRSKKRYCILDILLALILGSTGCIICFLNFCSLHPLVSPNYLLLLYNPLLLAYPFLICSSGRYKYMPVHYTLHILYALAIISWVLFIPQSGDYVSYPAYMFFTRLSLSCFQRR